jgi:hypothetical protein
MKTLKIKAVLLTDGEHYFIHGSDSEDASTMFKAMLPIWNFDPSKETAHVVEVVVTVPSKGVPYVVSEKPTQQHEPHHDDMPLTLSSDKPNADDRMALTLDDCKLS